MAVVDFLPGVQIAEVQLGAPPIAGVGTSTAGFVGKVPKDNRTDKTPKLVLITSIDDFAAQFIVGAKNADGTEDLATRAKISTPLSRAVRGFFSNGGTECYISIVTDDVAAPAVKAGLDLLATRDDIEIIAVPGNATIPVGNALIDQAEELKDRVAILDAPVATATFDQDLTDTTKRPKDSTYAALYFPRILVDKELENDTADPITPVGHIAGAYAGTDAQRGVHKAPANVALRGALGTEGTLKDSDQRVLNEAGVNALRIFAGNVTIWGARTLQENNANAHSEFRYINVRRLTNYLEQSLKAGLRFAVFEPNNLALRQTITRSVRGFLDGVFRDGALFGATPAEAYYVRFPDAFNRDEDRLLGILTVEIGFRPAPPAEFIIVRIGILTQSAAAS